MLYKIDQIENWLAEKFEFRYNTVANQAERIRMKQKGEKPTIKNFEPFNEDEMTYELLKAGHKSFSTELKAIMSNRKTVPEFDPFVDYFENLPKWDEKKPDYIGQLCSYIETSDDNWFSLMFRKMLVRIAACAIGEIAVNKQCIVFTGGQDAGKTYFFRYLCPKPFVEKYWGEEIDFDSKDSLLLLPKCFMINLDELDKYSKYDQSKVKAFISKSQIFVRPPFAKDFVSQRRRASFVASTNESEFLLDTTGNVRFIPIEIKKIKHDNGGKNGYAKNVDIDNVWSQAYYLLRTGYDFLLDESDKIKQQEINRNHMVETVEMQLVSRYFRVAQPKQSMAEFLLPFQVVERLNTYSQNNFRLSDRKVGQALKYYGAVLDSQRQNTQGQKYDYPLKGYWLIDVFLDTPK